MVTLDNLEKVMIPIKERWAHIVWPNVEPYYMVSTFGRIYDGYMNRIKTHIISDKYIDTNLRTIDGKSVYVGVHRLVATAFLYNPNPDKYNQVNHKDGRKSNNYVGNLEWVDRSLNMLHANRIGLGVVGEDHSYSKLTNSQVHIICKGLESNISLCDICMDICVPCNKQYKDIIRDIRDGETWKTISCMYNIKRVGGGIKRTFNDAEIHTICKGLELNKSYDDILELVGKTKSNTSADNLVRIKHVISNIKCRKTFTNISKDYKF